MKSTNPFIAAALAGAFAAATAASGATLIPGKKEKDDCPGKDKEKKEETVLAGKKDKDKDDCPGKKEEEILAGKKDKDKEDCPGKDKEKDGEIL